jgi:hypothetical protein
MWSLYIPCLSICYISTMPGKVYYAEFRDCIHHLASMGFSRKEIGTLSVVPKSTVSRTTHEEMGLRPAEVMGGHFLKLSGTDIQVHHIHACMCIVNSDICVYLLSVLEQQPDLYLDELQELELQGISHTSRYTKSVSIMMLMYLLHVLQLSKIAHQHDYLRRAHFWDTILQYDSTQLVSIDEAAVDSRNMNRGFGLSYILKYSWL